MENLQTINEDLREPILRAKRNEERILLMMKAFKSNKCFFPIIPPEARESKNSTKSVKFREEGNQLYSKSTSSDQMLNAIQKYSKSIAYAPTQSVELSVAWANQSAVLFRLQKYDRCLQAIDRCLSQNTYPEDMRIKVLLRKIECLVALGSPNLKKHYQDIREWIEMNISDLQKKKDAMKMLDGRYEKKGDLAPIARETDLQELFGEFHYTRTSKEVPCSSDALSLRYNDTFGRHIVAARDIRAGEILVRETPYCSVLDWKKRYMYCWKCLDVVWNCTPCSHCVYVVFCSEQCRDEAWKNFHKVECDLLPHVTKLARGEDTSRVVAALRMAILAVKEMGNIANLIEELNEIDQCQDPRKKGYSKDGKLYCNKYKSIYSLAVKTDNYHWSKIYNKLYLFLMYASVNVYILATTTTFFGHEFRDWAEIVQSSEAIFMGNLISHNLAVLDTNGFSAKESVDKRNKGVAVFSFLSFLNHSCKPNVAKDCRRDFDFLYSVYPIQKGEQLFISYIPNNSSSDKMARQMRLSEAYLFTCQCLACRENWPLVENYPDIEELVRCLSIKKKLKLTDVDTETGVLLAQPVFNHIKCKEDVPLVLKRLSDVLKLMMDNLTMPCKEIECVVRKIMVIFRNTKYIQGTQFLEEI